MREQGILLEYRIDMPFISGDVADFHPVKIKLTFLRGLKAADDSQGSCFTATLRTEQSNEFSIPDIQIHGVYYLLSVVRLGNSFQLNELCHFLKISDPFLRQTYIIAFFRLNTRTFIKVLNESIITKMHQFCNTFSNISFKNICN